jgi:hypothetical protein
VAKDADAERDAQERDEERRHFVGKMLDDPERGTSIFVGLMMAAMAGGNPAKRAAAEADAALAEIKRRFA